MELGMVVHACNPNIQEVDGGGVSGVQSQLQLHSNFLASLGYKCQTQNRGRGSPVGFGCLLAMRNCQA